MKIKRPHLIALQVLLVLGWWFLWDVASANAQPRNASSLACEEVEDCFEEDLEKEIRESLLTDSLHDPSILEVEPACFTQFSRTLDTAVAVRAAAPPSGWMMPLRI